MSSERFTGSKPKLSVDELANLVSTLRGDLGAIKAARAQRVGELQETIVSLAHENELLKRRLYGTKTERLRTSEK